ncbi:MAG: LCP family protein [Anaerolineales bacterium]|nr:LCP family protein [Anaerolineales bacterium]
MSRINRTALILMLLSMSACSLPSFTVVPVSSSSELNVTVQDAQVAAIAAENSPEMAITPTPFQPIPPTPVILPTGIPTSTPAPTNTPLPEPPIALSTLPVVEIDNVPNQTNWLLLGSDRRKGDKGYRTDTIILLTLNPKSGTAAMTSFPRDLWVYIPGYGEERINTAFYRGGFKMLAATMQHNFGVKPTGYVLIDFSNFKQIIDGLGGLDVEVTTTLTAKRQGRGYITIPKGMNHMNADKVLWYVRSRKTTNDFARNVRQQEVLMALAKKFLSMDGLSKAPDLYKKYKKAVITDQGFDDLIQYLPLAITLASDMSRIKHYYIGQGQVYDFVTAGGAMVLMPQKDKCQAVVKKALKGK